MLMQVYPGRPGCFLHHAGEQKRYHGSSFYDPVSYPAGNGLHCRWGGYCIGIIRHGCIQRGLASWEADRQDRLLPHSADHTHWRRHSLLCWGKWKRTRLSAHLHSCSVLSMKHSSRPIPPPLLFYSKPENRTRSYALNRLAINLGWAVGGGTGRFFLEVSIMNCSSG